ncbi:type-F conjugative transfer system protein TraW [Burkholderia cenocepacia]|jgi:conjugal transfer pilus assembly protein TraW|uniref:TraW conjugative transfer protein n=1 Tax=Burkholderia cenocepacia (strain ATCC BAA-245 / DSM 16553 / LMG 16656 / NCTC 13227 / J2315 / CF5610) TaxID=216591 RepID=B4EQG9_BURCJ|nr:type-F conjugative transfer system protein TraW [Burkholderia cenocepacia]KIS46041.1 type-F conjugative transfer system protein TraW [Burkholderia cepacia]KKI81711.1 conjugal transfer protein TraW [Burkholderia cenocepacia]ONR59009.1 type-F conjugative transfer system protein TraW [Burkholderia cenocepacia]ONR67502.1 type-F conjugative transfer system protein TraW [Burkholderia cenocepacia]ONR68508.1 type-F conjugative transfer system protein TraW [Burkholderia cenocepacia]
MKFSKAVAAAMLVAGAIGDVHAGMLGAIGPAYPIAEPDAVAQIMAKLRVKERSGELKRLQEAATHRSLDSAQNPAPVEGIRTATERSLRLIDPTVTYSKPVTTDDGRVVIPAGTKLNPLDLMPFTETLVFFDGRDREQAAGVERMMAHAGARVKPVLIAGSWLDLTKQFKKQVYFDQHGVLSARFGISVVPAVIQQRGKQLELSVIPAKELQ